MGKTRTCNFFAEVRCRTRAFNTGVMTLREAKNWLGKETTNGFVDKIYLAPQTAYGRRICAPGDEIQIDAKGVHRIFINKTT